MADDNELSSEKTKLENEKLRYELEELPRRSELEFKKLQSDIDNSQWAWLRVSGASFLTTVLSSGLAAWVAISVASATYSNERRKDVALAAQVARVRAEDNYIKARGALANGDSQVRANAALDVGSYIRFLSRVASGTETANAGWSQTDDTADLMDRIQKAEGVLIDRLASEDNPLLNRLISTMRDFENNSAVDLVASENRDANRIFSNNYGEVESREEMKAGRKKHASKQDVQAIESSVRSKLDAETIKAVVSIGGEAPKISSLILSGTTPGYNAYRAGKQSGNSPDGGVGQATITTLDRSARALAATSEALEALLRHSSGRLRGRDLSSVMLVDVGLDDVDLSGAVIKDAYISGVANRAHFDDCILDNAYLQNLDITGAIFRGTSLRRAYVSDQRKFEKTEKTSHKIIGSLANFTGSDRREMMMWNPEKQVFYSPTWLDHLPMERR